MLHTLFRCAGVMGTGDLLCSIGSAQLTTLPPVSGQLVPCCNAPVCCLFLTTKSAP